MRHVRYRLTYPGLTCEACRENEEVEGLPPPCTTSECQIPPAPESTRRALSAWQTASALREMGGGMALAGLTPWELELAAEVERFVQSTRAAAQGGGRGD